MTEHRVFLRAADTGNEIELSNTGTVAWAFKTGGASPSIPLRAHDHVDRQIIAEDWENTTWTLQFESGSERVASISGIHLLDRNGSSGPDAAAWTMADWRASLRTVMVDSTFNTIRALNNVSRPSAGAKVNENVALFAQVPKAQFILHTLQGADEDQPRFTSGSTDDVRPWTALSALKYFVTNEGWLRDYNEDRDEVTREKLKGLDNEEFEFGPLLVSDLVEDNLSILKNWNPRGTWSEAVNYLARRARVHVFAGPNREVVIQSGDPKHINDALLRYGKYAGGGGVPTLATLNRRAPRRVDFRFPEKQEIRWDFDETAFLRGYKINPNGSARQGVTSTVAGGIYPRIVWQDIQNRSIFLLENVLRLPQDIGIYAKGTWVPIPVALDLWKNDTKNTPVNTLGKGKIFTYQTILRYIMTTGLANLYQKDVNRVNYRNPILEARVSSIYQNFRQTYRIPECWLDHIESWQPQLSSIFSESARARQPSPVWLDHHTWDSHINVVSDGGNGKDKSVGKGYVRNSPLKGESELPFLGKTLDAFTSNAFTLPSVLDQSFDVKLDDLQTPSMAAIQVVDAKQGVFRTGFPPDLSGQTVLHTPGLLDFGTLPTRSVENLRNLGVAFIGRAKQLPGHRMITILTVKWRSPNTNSRHFKIKFHGSSFLPGASGGKQDIMFRGFEAIRSWKDGAVKWNIDGNGLLNVHHGGPIENPDVLKEVAVGEVNELYFQYQPRVLGMFKADTWTGQMPIGHVGATTVSLTNGVYETTLAATGAPRAVSAWEFFSPYTRDIISRLNEGTNASLEP